MAISIVYEDDDILAVNKPSGISVHGDGKTDEYTLSDFILENYPENREIGEPIVLSDGRRILRPGIVHRLDKDTSGILVVAKNQKSYEFLKNEFKSRRVEKVYRAIVYGNIKENGGEIVEPIGRSRSDFRKRDVGSRARGELKPAVTLFRVLERFKAYTYVELHPKTGRTHQLRVHLKFIGNPVVCDSLYAPKRACPFGISRQMLHAYSLGIKSPSGADIFLVADLPDDFVGALDSIRTDFEKSP